MSSLRYLLILIFISVFPVSTFADHDSASLTCDNVNRFLKSIPAIQKWNKEKNITCNNTFAENKDDPRFAVENALAPFNALLKSKSDFKYTSELDKIVEEYGFQSFKQWSKVGKRLSNAYLASSNILNGTERQMRALQAVEKEMMAPDNGLPLGHQEVLVTIIRTAESSLQDINNITPREIRLVKRNISSIEKAFMY